MPRRMPFAALRVTRSPLPVTRVEPRLPRGPAVERDLDKLADLPPGERCERGSVQDRVPARRALLALEPHPPAGQARDQVLLLDPVQAVGCLGNPDLLPLM